jgi:methylthioribose-1-phosphate isomerase
VGLVHIRFDADRGVLSLLDQRLLPRTTAWVDCRSASEVACAIRDMVVRGAPAIGVAAAYGMAIASLRGDDLDEARQILAASRPTAVNLAWALDRMDGARAAGLDLAVEARAVHDEDVAINRRMGAHGAGLLHDGVLTICNTGTLATGGHGTALGVVRSALEAGAKLHLYACETRPYDQGARLTTWECWQDGIPCTLIADSMAAALMVTGEVHAVIVGCDRVAANGDTANKIGTYGLAVLADYHRIPFYVAMPTSTLDRGCPCGAEIPIEQRPAAELFDAVPVEVWNPSFDVTPAGLVTAWITEDGIWRTIPE